MESELSEPRGIVVHVKDGQKTEEQLRELSFLTIKLDISSYS